MKRKLSFAIFLIFALALSFNFAKPAQSALSAPTGTITRVSISSGGVEGNEHSFGPSISADGRYVAFWSSASNLVPADTNGAADVFVHDRETHELKRVSVSSNGQEGNDASDLPSISADGHYVAFESLASNLVSGDTNNGYDIFVYNMLTGELSIVSLAWNGAQGNYDSYNPVISADGRYVAFESAATNLVAGAATSAVNVFLRDTVAGGTQLVSVSTEGTAGNEISADPAISADGRYIAFWSAADNLVGEDLNYTPDIFVHDMVTGETSLVSVASDGTQADSGADWPSISGDGRYVSFQSWSTNLVPGDTNEMPDVFVHDVVTGATARVSVSSAGQQGNSYSESSSSLSSDGRYVTFWSNASNLVSGDTNGSMPDVFIHDTVTGETIRVSLSASGAEGNGGSFNPVISADGRYVAFESEASNLVSGDTNGLTDIFIRDQEGGNPPPSGAFKIFVPMILK